MDKILSFLKCIGDKTRLKMLKLLLEDEFCVCQLTAILDKSQSSVSQHLRYFKELELVKEKKDSKWTYYSINRKKYDEYLAKIFTLSGKTFSELNLDKMEERYEIVKSEKPCETRQKIK
ncbi:MAG TPA: metalloregulator ArsR/SmtB family transcription factor [Halanaerobiales bacterium]|nr:metalloregulator ArsR/SmtB family transcription factor [Halanaerobiales bacterium]